MKQRIKVLANGKLFEVVQNGDVPNKRYPDVRWFKPGDVVVIGKKHADLLSKVTPEHMPNKRIDAWADFNPDKLKRWAQYGWTVGVVMEATKPK
jgi:hypothetical protein